MQVVGPTQQSAPSTHAPEPLLVDLAGAARLLSISKRHVEDLEREAKMPAAVRLGRSLRWRLCELRLWVEAGCPSRSEWEIKRKAVEASST